VEHVEKHCWGTACRKDIREEGSPDRVLYREERGGSLGRTASRSLREDFASGLTRAFHSVSVNRHLTCSVSVNGPAENPTNPWAVRAAQGEADYTHLTSTVGEVPVCRTGWATNSHSIQNQTNWQTTKASTTATLRIRAVIRTWSSAGRLVPSQAHSIASQSSTPMHTQFKHTQVTSNRMLHADQACGEIGVSSACSFWNYWPSLREIPAAGSAQTSTVLRTLDVFLRGLFYMFLGF